MCVLTAPSGSPPSTERVPWQRRLEQHASVKIQAAEHAAATSWCVLFLAGVFFQLLICAWSCGRCEGFRSLDEENRWHGNSKPPFFLSGNVAITVEGSLVDFNARQFQDSLSSALRTRKPGEIKTLGVRMGNGVVVDVRVVWRVCGVCGSN